MIGEHCESYMQRVKRKEGGEVSVETQEDVEFQHLWGLELSFLPRLCEGWDQKQPVKVLKPKFLPIHRPSHPCQLHFNRLCLSVQRGI